MASTILVVDDSPTIRKVVTGVLETRGFTTLGAADGREALEILRSQPVDMVLLDFVMPVMNGYQFCRELRADPKLAHLPVVLMSAKGDKIRGQFVQQTGAVDAITKPFDPRALVAVVETTLRKPLARDSKNPKTPADPAFDLEKIESIDDPERRASEVANLFAKGLAALVQPAISKLGPRPEAEKLTSALRDAMQPARLRGLGGLLSLLDKRRSESAVLAGDLGFISIAEVLQMLELQRQTGALRISYGDQEIVLYLGTGRVDFASSTNLPASFRLGRFLVEDGVVSREQLDPVLQDSETRRLLGEELERRGIASPDQVQGALKRQTCELVYEAVRWRNGRFTFDVDQSCPEATLAQLALAPGGLLMEGFRRVDEWQLIEGSFQFDDVLTVDQAAVERLSERSNLEPLEELVLATIDGKLKVRQIVDEVDASTFDVCKALYQFLNSGVVRRKSV